MTFLSAFTIGPLLSWKMERSPSPQPTGWATLAQGQRLIRPLALANHTSRSAQLHHLQYHPCIAYLCGFIWMIWWYECTPDFSFSAIFESYTLGLPVDFPQHTLLGFCKNVFCFIFAYCRLFYLETAKCCTVSYAFLYRKVEILCRNDNNPLSFIMSFSGGKAPQTVGNLQRFLTGCLWMAINLALHPTCNDTSTAITNLLPNHGWSRPQASNEQLG